MFDRIIDEIVIRKQVSNVIEYNSYIGVVFLSNNEVYCPMCEHRHENNSNCQRMG